MRRLFLSRHGIGIALGLLLSLASAAASATTYAFTGGPYTVIANFTPACGIGTCGNFTGAMQVSGTFDTAAPLPPGLVAQEIRPLITGLHFTDGLTTYDFADPKLRFRRTQVTTDAGGAVIGVDFLVQRWDTPGAAHAALDRLDMIRFATASSTAFKNLFCNNVATTVDADSCQSANPADPFTSRADGAGAALTVVLVQPPAPLAVPAVHTWALLALAALLGALGVLLGHKGKAARPS